jgi:hypothetical protein
MVTAIAPFKERTSGVAVIVAVVAAVVAAIIAVVVAAVVAAIVAAAAASGRPGCCTPAAVAHALQLATCRQVNGRISVGCACSLLSSHGRGGRQRTTYSCLP